jgi:hypothetical protein
MRVSRWGFAAAALVMLAVPALAHHSKNCRPYTIEKVCWEKGRACHLHMVYAPGHNPAGAIPDGYWYSAKPKKHGHKHRKSTVAQHKKRHGSVYATCRSFDCWYRHDPEHRY